MTRYDVLEAHQGDKFYKPGDPETGTRLADPNTVAHLVTLGLLKEAEDQSGTDLPTVPDTAPSVGDLQAQLLAVTQERDEARAELATLRTPASEHDYVRDNLGELDLHKPATSKSQLLVIAAYEQADVEDVDKATKADLIKAIEAKRKAG